MIQTQRLLLRPWREEDRAPFAAMNADPEVRRYFPSIQTREESDASVDRVMADFQVHGFCFWAVERRDTGEFIGFTGLKVLGDEEPISPGVEIGWRLARHAWGWGYASEAARAALADGFGPRGLTEILAFTAKTNAPSEAVMRRIGMQRDAARDFEHPAVPVGDPLRPHIVYVAKP